MHALRVSDFASPSGWRPAQRHGEAEGRARQGTPLQIRGHELQCNWCSCPRRPGSRLLGWRLRRLQSTGEVEKGLHATTAVESLLATCEAFRWGWSHTSSSLHP